MEPFYVAQSNVSPNVQFVWFELRAIEAKKEGAIWMRFTVHPEYETLVLAEGWKAYPKNQGEPRFSFELKKVP